MGVRRKSRARLAAVKKAGIIKDTSPSPNVMAKALVNATQHRIGQMVVTDLIFDLGSSKVTISTEGLGAADPIGLNDNATPASRSPSYLCRVTDDIFGVVTTVETMCLEQITDGTLYDYDLMFASGADGTLGSDATGDQLVLADIAGAAIATDGTPRKHSIVNVKTLVGAEECLKNQYLYITAGAATTKKATAVIECGAADKDNITSGLTRIRLARSNGTATVDIVADSGKAKSATDAGFFGISDVTTTAHLATSISNGIGATTDVGGTFATSVTDTTNVTVTVNQVNSTSNNTNYLVDDPENASGIVVPNFTGGIPNELTAGKLLVRLTGFIVPEDLK